VSASAPDTVCRLQTRVAELIGAQRYKVWFKDATQFTIADDFLKVGVPNLFVGRWIENHFSDSIAQAANEVAGRSLDVIVSIEPNLAKKLRKKQPDSQVRDVARDPVRQARKRKKTDVASPEPPVFSKCFEEFIVGPCNQLAYSAAMAAAEHPGSAYNPLFLHGGCGLGKTHLLQAIGQRIRERNPDADICYITGEEFTNQFVYAVRSGERDAFQRRFRSADVLILDDIHFFANKKGTQDEFLHTFNAIDAVGRQVVMASDAHPKLIGHLSESLVTRFLAGMVVRLETPDRQTRIGVLKNYAAKRRAVIPDSVLEYIADHLQTNLRELEGALLKVIALAHVARETITCNLAEEALSDLIPKSAQVVKLSDIENAVAIFFGLAPADLHTSRKTRTIALARGIAMYLARKHTDMSYPEIGRFMGNKNHTTVLLANRRIGGQFKEKETVTWVTPVGEKSMNIVDIVSELETQLIRSPAEAA
jgi:chromosomal replication initiator protein